MRKAAGQTDSQVDASQRKFAKPELAYGLAKGDQTDSTHKFTQVAKAVNFTHIQMTCDQLVSICIGWPNGELSLTKVHASRRKWVAKRNASRKLALTCESA